MKRRSENAFTTSKCCANQLDESKKSFQKWSKMNKMPFTVDCNSDENDDDNTFMKALGEAVGDSKVVALSEGCHNNKEMMDIHFRIIKYLVKNHGFNVVMAESGFPESRIAHDYIYGSGCSKEEKNRVYEKGLNIMYAKWKEGRQLIEWMRNYNKDSGNNRSKLQYYGTDIGGFYENWVTPLQDRVIDYLKVVDEPYEQKLVQMLEPVFKYMKSDARYNYSNEMEPEVKNQLALDLDRAIDHFTKNELRYIELSSSHEYDWARQSLISFQMAENYYRNYDGMQNFSSSKHVGLNGREIAMYCNIRWIMQQNPNAKCILINHIIHTKTETQYQGDIWNFFTPLGHMLRQLLGKDYYVLGIVYGGGTFWNNWQSERKKGSGQRAITGIPSPRDDGIEAILSCISSDTNKPNFFLNFDDAPASAWYWLNTLTSFRENDYFIKMKPIEWNGCIYLERVNAATPVDVDS